MRFTVADVERFKDVLKNAKPTCYVCVPPADHPPSSTFNACFTLYSVDEFDTFLDALEKRNEHMARYVLTAAGKLCFGHEGDSGKFIPEHWQMLGQEMAVIAAGNIFVKNRKITSLSDQSSCSTGLLSLVYTLRALHKNTLPLALSLELIQSKPDSNGEYSSFITRADLQNMLHDDTACDHEPDDALLDDEDVRPLTPQPDNRFVFFHNNTDACIRVNLQPSINREFAAVSGTRTTKEVAPPW